MENSKDKDIIDRGNWTGKLDFILSCIGYAVGLGNIWRFPYLCYRNGGGAFLVPYVIMLIIAGVPLFFFELCLGQFASEGPITVWKVNPFFMGIGWGMILITSMVCVYYNVVIMYAMYYLFVSFVHLDDKLPWQTCGNEWNTPYCRTEAYPRLENMNETNKVTSLLELKEMSCVNATSVFSALTTKFMENITSLADLNSTMLQDTIVKDCDKNFRTASEEYWSNYVTQLDDAEPDRLYDIGSVSLKNVLCLFLAWILIFFCLMKGVKSSGKVVYFTATFPYVVLVILLIRGVTLEGYLQGIEFYIIPKWEELKDPKVWGDAATQIFYSLGVAFGSLITMSSYNKFRNNAIRDAFIVSLVNCGTSVFAGFAIFSLLGHMAYITNRDVSQVADSGPGLAFVAYPEGIAKLGDSWAPIVAFLFFFMVFTLGLDSQFGMMEAVISGFTDMFPRVLRKHKALFTFVCCMIGFLLGIPQTCKGGIYILTLMDWYSGSYNLMIICLCELIAVCWIYGIKNFRKDVEMMLGRKSNAFWVYWFITWMAVTPVAIIFIVVMSAVTYGPAYYIGPYGQYDFPPFAEVVGWLMSLTPILCIFIGMAIQTYRKGGVRAAIRPEPTWGPALDEDRIGRYAPLNDINGGGNGVTNMAYIHDKSKIPEDKHWSQRL